MDGDDGGGMKQYDDHEMITWDVWVCNIERKYDDEKKNIKINLNSWLTENVWVHIYIY